MSLDITKEHRFERLFYNASSNRIVALLRYNDLKAPLGCMYSRKVSETRYESIGPSGKDLSVESVIVPRTIPELYLSVFRISGSHGEWDGVFTLNLEDLSLNKAFDKSDLVLPKPFNDVAVLNLINYDPDLRVLDCKLLLRQLEGTEVIHSLCAVDLNSKTVTMLSRLESPFF